MVQKNNLKAKIIRTITSILPVAKERKGSCNNCGKCCHLPNKCPFLRMRGEKSYCIIHKIRPLNCRKYPRVEKEWITREDCGYYFEKK